MSSKNNPTNGTPKIRSGLQTITPDTAAKWLKRNVKNRRLSRITVDRYKRELTSGEWEVTGAAIVFDWDGNLSDGQHRLTACVESGVSFQSIVVRGVAPAAFAKQDQNKIRTSGDILGMEHFQSATTVAASVVAIQEIEESIETGVMPGGMGWGAKRRSMPHEVLQFAQANREMLAEAATVVRGSMEARSVLRPPSAFAALFFVLAKRNLSRAREFFQLLATGESLARSSPIYKCRTLLVASLADKLNRRSSPWKVAVTIKAWNAWLEGTTVNQLRFRKDENFPTPRHRAAAHAEPDVPALDR